jgi:hypothetical protein
LTVKDLFKRISSGAILKTFAIEHHKAFDCVLNSPSAMSSGVEKLKNKKSIAILDAAEKGGYGIVSVVCVSLKYLHSIFSTQSLTRINTTSSKSSPQPGQEKLESLQP